MRNLVTAAGVRRRSGSSGLVALRHLGVSIDPTVLRLLLGGNIGRMVRLAAMLQRVDQDLRPVGATGVRGAVLRLREISVPVAGPVVHHGVIDPADLLAATGRAVHLAAIDPADGPVARHAATGRAADPVVHPVVMDLHHVGHFVNGLSSAFL
jgi:hypothetical protein